MLGWIDSRDGVMVLKVEEWIGGWCGGLDHEVGKEIKWYWYGKV